MGDQLVLLRGGDSWYWVGLVLAAVSVISLFAISYVVLLVSIVLKASAAAI